MGIVIKELSHSFKNGKSDHTEVLDNISFKLDHGDSLSIIGPSGCGKTTLLKCISGLIDPSNGFIEIEGLAPDAARDDQLIGFAFQDPLLLRWRNVEENIILFSELGRNPTMDEKYLEYLLELIGLKTYRKYFPHQISGGMKQRVSLARALLTKPKVLLLDEPFASLDILTRTRLAIELRTMIDKLATPTILVTHSIEEALIFGKRVIILSNIPARIIDTYNTGFENVDVSILDKEEFIGLVTKCKKQLLGF